MSLNCKIRIQSRIYNKSRQIDLQFYTYHMRCKSKLKIQIQVLKRLCNFVFRNRHLALTIKFKYYKKHSK